MTEAEIKKAAIDFLCTLSLHGEYALSFLRLSETVPGSGIGMSGISEYNESLPDSRFSLSIKPGEGFTVIDADESRRFVFYDDASYPDNSEVTFAIAHEIGHCILGHTSESAENEAEAEQFAYELLMPECVIRYLDAENGEELSTEKLKPFFRATERELNARRIQISERPFAEPDEKENELLNSIFLKRGNKNVRRMHT